MVAVHSKLLTPIYATCRECVHPYDTTCAKFHANCFVYGAVLSSKIYFTVYVISFLLRRKKLNISNLSELARNFARSALFLSTQTGLVSATVCFLRRLFGSFNFLSIGFLPAFLSGIVSINIETAGRQSMLASYLCNNAIDSVWNWAVITEKIHPQPYGAAAIFGISTAILQTLARIGLHKHGDTEDLVFKLLRFITSPCEDFGYIQISSEEQKTNMKTLLKTNEKKPGRNRRTYKFLIEFLMTKSRKVENICPHPYSCTHYTINAMAKLFAVGYALKAGLAIFSKPKILAQPKMLLTKNMCTVGIFLAGYTGLYRAMSCLLRRLTGQDNPLYAIPSAIIASSAYKYSENRSLTIYAIIKVVQQLYNLGVKMDKLPELKLIDKFVYALSFGILLHFGFVNPEALRPSYWNFLVNATGGRMAHVDMDKLAVMGLTTNPERVDALIQATRKATPIRTFF